MKNGYFIGNIPNIFRQTHLGWTSAQRCSECHSRRDQRNLDLIKNPSHEAGMGQAPVETRPIEQRLNIA